MPEKARSLSVRSERRIGVRVDQVMNLERLRICNISAFYGDRDDALSRALAEASCDVLVGDYLAEITMGILARQRASNPDAGFARSLLRQLRTTLGTLVASGTKLVTNAGGVNPRALAAQIQALAEQLDVSPVVAFMEGDDLAARIHDSEWLSSLRHFHDGTAFDGDPQSILAANAYLGSWGIVAALNGGADLVVCPRVTDVAVTIGPAAWHFGWSRTSWDQLAGAAVAGHILECGGQATGGNFSFYREIPGLEEGAGRPIVEIRSDGGFEVELHPRSGGAVTIDTVTAQLLYEVDSTRYMTPDVTVHWDSIEVSQVGDNRVTISGVRGDPPPKTLKAGLSYVTGYRNTMTFAATGPDAKHKLDLALGTLKNRVDSDQFEEFKVTYLRRVESDIPLDDVEIVEARVTASSKERALVDRSFANEFVGLSLETYPGFFLVNSPGSASPLIGFWPFSIPREGMFDSVILPGKDEPEVVPYDLFETGGGQTEPEPNDPPQFEVGSTVLARLGTIIGARSGDKGGNANVGVWARSDDAYHWLRGFLTVDRLRSLLPETASLRVERHPFPPLRAMNFVIYGILGDGAAASLRSDPQAKGLGEYLRSRYVPIPESLMGNADPYER